MEITVDRSKLKSLATRLPKNLIRAGEKALDNTARAIRDEVRAAMPKVFDRPTPYTLNSLKVELTHRHNMTARVWFKDPERMSQHYLVPQVIGGPRRLKGFERGFDNRAFMPSRSAKLNQYGNISAGQIIQLRSVLGRAEMYAGYLANKTATSEKRNRKPRDYVWFHNRHGRLPPGIYQRYQTGPGFGAKTKKTMPFGEWQKGRTKGRFSSVVRARGLRPVLIETRISRPYTPRLPFYKIGHEVFGRKFQVFFHAEFSARIERNG